MTAITTRHSIFAANGKRVDIVLPAPGCAGIHAYKGGKKYRPQDQWITVTGTHEACLDPETAQRVISLRGLKGSQKRYR